MCDTDTSPNNKVLNIMNTATSPRSPRTGTGEISATSSCPCLLRHDSLGTPPIELIWRLRCEAAECSHFAFSSAQYVPGVPSELSVYLCKWNHQLGRTVASSRASGCRFQLCNLVVCQQGSYASIFVSSNVLLRNR
jgi:hypothetical protein